MNVKTFTFLLILMLLPLLVLSQQKPQYSQYMINNYLLNPAITGIEDYVDIKSGFRNQWTGIDGSPSNFYLSVHTKLSKDKSTSGSNSPSFVGAREPRNIYRKYSTEPHHGIGLLLLHDKIGPFTRIEANVSYAYHVPLTDEIKLAAGASAGVTQHALNGNKLIFANPADAASAGWTVHRPNLRLGMWLYSANFYAGVSASELISNTVSAGDDRGIDINYDNHYFLTAAYKVPVAEKLDVIPSVMLKLLRPLPVSADYNLRAIYDNKLWAGVSYRQNDSFAFLAGITWNQVFDLGYSYDAGVSSLGGVSHEVVLGMRIPNKHKIVCPQNLW
ncbi:type IX secretion system membrane protein PorP/SprF [Pontibacter diazotrophicus]|uniref:Type IX secretion system membrane protein PorP/SprF n=1 Tax=Pontibacter diazotrophicus TaxID=1400979 RepID=A0A3D8LBA3_9BACT|nr:type IX secretion system membrane protein PorP/SprF [Pontibacter diazotrophicus]RDV14680.1 type IX secretion system membrane protein PorP/SprF [Pontibacter diazotrophicus]